MTFDDLILCAVCDECQAPLDDNLECPRCLAEAYECEMESRIERERERVHDFERYPTDEGGPVNE